MFMPGLNHKYFGLFIYIFCCLLVYSHSQPQVGPLDHGNCDRGDVQCRSNKCIPEYWQCDGDNDCPDGDDEHNVTCLNMECFEGLFDCVSNREKGVMPYCIYSEWTCDGENDCEGGDDELLARCEQPETPRPPGPTDMPENCQPDEFRCNDGSCIPDHFQCDHARDCLPDGEDEPTTCNYTACTPEEFQCKEMLNCISNDLKCSGIWDCGDGSDEADELCNPVIVTCPAGEFKCTNGNCIGFELVCQGDNDCVDNSDELNCGVNECENDATNLCEPKNTCRNTQTSFKCVCPNGHRLDETGLKCVEIDECNEWPQTCSQLCENTPGSFICKCTQGFELINGTQCIYMNKEIQPWIIYANRFYIHKMKLDGTKNSTISAAHSLAHVLDFNYATAKIYYADASDEEIGSLNYDGSTTENDKLFWYGVRGTEGVAVDWVNKKLYWTSRQEQGSRSIRVSELNGTLVKTLFTKDETTTPRAIVVHPGRGYLFWTDWSIRPFIGRAGMDGSGFTKIITSGIYWPNALTMDYYTDMLYLADAHIDHIIKSDLDGNNRHVLFKSLAHVYSINIFEHWIFWADWNTKKIERANRFTGQDRSVIATLSLQPYDMHVYHPGRQPAFPNPCDSPPNGGCSHLCLIAPGGKSTCHCPLHYDMSADGKTCISNCNSRQFQCGASDPKCIPHTWECDGEEDCRGGEDETEALCANRKCESDEYQCANWTSSRDCINLLYVCDGDLDCRDGSDEGTTFCANRECVPGQFKCGTGRCISRGWLCDDDNDCPDNSDELPLNHDCKPENTKCASGEFRCNNSRCIPETWMCDFDNDCGDMSDEPRGRECWGKPCQTGWFRCQTNYRCIPEMLRCNGDDDCRDNSDENPAMCPACEVGEFECDNGDCIPERWKCDFEEDCSDDGSDKSDEDKEMCKKSGGYRPCTDIEFRCGTELCIRKDQQCDGQDDCGDNSDESITLCASYVCPEEMSKCTSGHCYYDEYKCDGDADCRDATDEVNCPTRFPNGRYCETDKFECANTVCIPTDWICDADDDCGDGSDETIEQCRDYECDGAFRFKCNNSLCIHRLSICDGVDNCKDGSDENHFGVCKAHLREPCSISEFRCANHECIDATRVCNGINNCGLLANGTEDLSDEVACYKDSSTNCSINNGGCQQTCVNLPPNGHYCSCNKGYAVNTNDPKSCLDIDECATWGNNCTQNCVNSKVRLNVTTGATLNHGYICQCWPGFTPTRSHEDQSQICHVTRNDREGLILAIDQSLRVWQQAEGVGTHPGTKEIVRAGIRIKSFDVDARNRLVYWTDSVAKKIFRAVIPTETTPTLVAQDTFSIGDTSLPVLADPQDLRLYVSDPDAEQGQPDGIAYDWVAKNIYWSDIVEGSIKVATENGSYIKTIVSSMGVRRKPTSLVVNPARGYLYWVDIQFNKIEHSYMDGSQVKVIVGLPLEEVTGLAIDYWSNGRLYWCDMKRNMIFTSNWDGSEPRIVVRNGLNNPYSIDVFGSDLYWISLQSSTVKKMDKFGRGVNLTLQSNIYNAKDIKMFHSQRYNLSIPNPCLSRRCARFPLCLLKPGPTPDAPSATCACPDGHDFLLPSSSASCNVAPEAGLPYPDACGCQNYGSCVRDRMSEQPLCICPNGYAGKKCEQPVPTGGTGPVQPPPRPPVPATPRPKPPTKKPRKPTPTPAHAPVKGEKQDDGGGNIVPVVVTILVVFLVLLGVILLVLYLYRSGRIGRTKTGRGEFRPGPQSGTNNAASPYDHPEGDQGFTGPVVELTPDGAGARFSNPLYDIAKNGDAPRPDAENNYAEIPVSAEPLPLKEPIGEVNA